MKTSKSCSAQHELYCISFTHTDDNLYSCEATVDIFMSVVLWILLLSIQYP